MNSQSPYLKWERLGLTRNPFQTAEYATDSVHYVSVPEIERAFASSESWMQILADKGRGKTTILRALCGGGTYEWLPEGRSDFVSRDTRGAVFFLDEAQRLSRNAWARLLSAEFRPRRLIFSSHEDQCAWLTRLGVICESIVLTPSNPEWIDAVLNGRIERYSAVIDPPRVTPEAIEELILRHGTDIRAMEETLYHVFQDLQTRELITRDRIQKCCASGHLER